MSSITGNIAKQGRLKMDNQNHYEDLPLVLCVEDLMQLLSIGRNTAYELVRSGKIKSIRIGKCYRIPRDSITEYLAKVQET